MHLDQDDLPYFVPYVLLDEASRPPSGKRQTKPMTGFWMCRQGKTGMRQSDGRLRRHVCIEVLRRIGRVPVAKAAAQVAAVLGRRTAASVNVIRLDYYERRSDSVSWASFFSQYVSWRAWVLESEEEALQFILDKYGREFGQPRRRRLAKLIEDLRQDPVQVARNRTWLLLPAEPARTRIESNYWDSESDWQFLATDLWVLGRLRAAIGEMAEAKSLLGRALDIWKTQGHNLAHVQVRAIPELEEEIARLAPGDALGSSKGRAALKTNRAARHPQRCLDVAKT